MNTLDSTLQFQTDALKLSSQRQQLVASNIANADTPNYQAQDLNFSAALASAQQGNQAGTLVKTQSAHQDGMFQIDTPAAVITSTAPQPAVDGNSVDMDVERARFADAVMHYQAAFTFLNGQIKTLLSAVQG